MRNVAYFLTGWVLLLLIFGVYFWSTKKEILPTPPVFSEYGQELYFVAGRIMGFSSLYRLGVNNPLLPPGLLATHFGEIFDPVLVHKRRSLYYGLRRDRNSLVYVVDINAKVNNVLADFSNRAISLGKSCFSENLVFSYSEWKDTNDFFVGFTLGDWDLTVVDFKSRSSQKFLTHPDAICSPQLLTEDVMLFKSFSFFEEPREFKTYNLKTKEERYLPIEVHVDQWCYDDKNNRIYFQGKGFVWEYDMASEKLRKLFAFKEEIDFLVKHPVEMKFLVKFSNNPKTMFYVDADGVVSKFFSI